MTKTDKNSVPVTLLKSNKDILSPIFSNMINQSFKTAIFPDDLKCGILSPLLKTGDSTDRENFRPITGIHNFSKIFERSIYNRLLKFLTDFSILSPHQFGFRKNMSTESAIISLTEFLYEVINSKEIALNICIDFRKAFDTVNHKILIDKFDKYGVRGPSLALI